MGKLKINYNQMRKITIAILFLGYIQAAFAQKSAGKITFEKKRDWVKIQSKATYLSKEQKDRMAQTWKNETEYKQKMVLNFNEKQSHYTFENQEEQSEDGTYSWRNDLMIITRDFENEKILELHETLGKTYIVEDSLRFDTWKILNEIKDVSGYICMKASAYDPVKRQNIIAWFTTDIPVSAGPERFGGLPGMILELNIDDDAIVYTPSLITLAATQEIPKLPKKQKGKKVTIDNLNKEMDAYIKQQEAMHNFPWAIRY
jgi:GLPGLI family protein